MKRHKIKEEGGFIKETKEKKNVGGRLIVSLIITAMLITALVVVRNTFTEKEQTYSVVCSTKEIPINVVITEDNINEYFALKDIPLSLLPQGCYRQKTDVVGNKVVSKIPQNAIITSCCFVKESDILNTMDNPVLMGIALNNSSDGLNGTLRPGDVVDIVFCETKKNTTIRNVYIVDAFDNSGVSIAVSNSSAIASRINVYIESDYVTSFAEHLKNADVYISKIKYDTSQRLFVPTDSDYELNIKTPISNPETDTSDETKEDVSEPSKPNTENEVATSDSENENEKQDSISTENTNEESENNMNENLPELNYSESSNNK